MKFKTWLEGWEGFGVGRKVDPTTSSHESENPIDGFDVEEMHDILIERGLGPMRPQSKFINEIVWGDQPGAIRYRLGPQWVMTLDRLATDLEGNRKWFTKRALQINRSGYGGYEQLVAQEVYDGLEKLYETPNDSPISSFTGLRQLAISMAEKVRRTCRPVFMFQKIIEHSQNRYLICFEVRGGGVEAPSQQRVEELVIDANYYPNQGDIRVLVYTVQSATGRAHEWAIQPSEYDFSFLPTQGKEEIIEPVALVMRYF